ncbi:MAG: cupin domain-containing protein [Betaproteobacteria bacterium]|nr:MAG: cupin domain-containing protein [Betaproteobacteria bacterium]
MRTRNITRKAAIAKLTMGLALLAPLAVTNANSGSDDEGFAITQAAEQSFQPLPGIDGVSYSKVFGDSSQPGVYIVRVRFDPWTMTMPHYHNNDRLVAVIQGTWYAGTHTEFDATNTTGIQQGGYMLHPAGGVHFDGAKEETAIVQITGTGPNKTTFLEPERGRSRRLK